MFVLLINMDATYPGKPHLLAEYIITNIDIHPGTLYVPWFDTGVNGPKLLPRCAVYLNIK